MDLRRPLLFASLLLPALAGPASAQQISDADHATARTLAAEAHDAFDKKDYVTAADRFARADSLVHAPTLLLGLAQSDIALGKWVAAQEILNRILREGVPAGSPPPFTRALGDAKKELDALAPRIPFVIVQVTGPSAGAIKATIDGVELPAAVIGMKRPVDPGKHDVRATAEGFSQGEVAVAVAEGKTETATIELKEMGESQAPPPAGTGMRARTKLGIAGLAVGGAGLVFGAITGGIAVAKHGELAKSCPAPAGNCDATVTQKDLTGYTTTAALSTIGFAVGGALAVTGLVLLVTAPKAKPAAARIAPVIGPGFVGATGRF